MHRLRQTRQREGLFRQSLLTGRFFFRMPAVQLARLRIQIAKLGESFQNPEAFRQELEALLERYGDRTFRCGEEILNPGQLKCFYVPPLVMRQLEMELSRLSGKDIQSNFDLVDGIWKSDYLEMRQIAIYLLGRIAIVQPRSYFATLKKWCQPGEDPAILEALLCESGEKIRAAQPESWLSLVNGWLNHTNFRYQEIGLIALEPFLATELVEYLPDVFDLLESLLKDTPLTLQKRLLIICQLLYKISPTETLVYFKHLVESNASAHFFRLMRRLLPSMENEDRERLKLLLPRTIQNLRSDP